MELGVARSIGVEHIICDGHMSTLINNWLEEHTHVQVIDIKLASAATYDEWTSEVLIIYRKNS